jgi:hypothetical protein
VGVPPSCCLDAAAPDGRARQDAGPAMSAATGLPSCRVKGWPIVAASRPPSCVSGPACGCRAAMSPVLAGHSAAFGA